MLVNEFRAVVNKGELDRQFGGRNAQVVVILPKDGKDFYVSRRGGTTEDRGEAFVYDYDMHGVADQCSQVVAMMGVVPKVVEV